MPTEERRYVLNFEGNVDDITQAINAVQKQLVSLNSPKLFGDDIKDIDKLNEEITKFKKATTGKTEFSSQEAKEILKSGEKIVKMYNDIGGSIRAARKEDLSKFLPAGIQERLNKYKTALAEFRTEYQKLERNKTSNSNIEIANQKRDAAKSAFETATQGKKVVNDATYKSYEAEVQTANKKLVDARLKSTDAENKLTVSEENLTKATAEAEKLQKELSTTYREKDVARAEAIHKSGKKVINDKDFETLAKEDRDKYIRRSESEWAEDIYGATHGERGGRKKSVSFVDDSVYDELEKQAKAAQRKQAQEQKKVAEAQNDSRMAKATLTSRETEAKNAQDQLDNSIKQSDYEKLKKAYDEAAASAQNLANINKTLIEQQQQLFKKLQEQTGLDDKVGENNSETEIAAAVDAKVENERSEAIEKLGAGIEKVGKAHDDATPKVEKFTQAQEEQRDRIDSTNKELEKTSSITRRIKAYVSLNAAIRLTTRALRNAFQTVKELDAVMTQTAVVTDFSVGDMWAQLPEYTKRANELGVSIKSAYESSTLFYQQGLKTAEVIDVSNATLKMARIAGLSAEDATNKMTAALRGFNMEVNKTNATNVADVYSKLASITASNVKEISTAMTNTASIANSAGMSFETTAAFLSQVIETTRESATTAGTALKTVIARFQELKKSPDEIGEVDGEIVDANKIETALRTVGIALRDEQGQFRNLDEVFLELSKRWQTLDTNTQRYIATIAAGSRQQSRFIAMMSDYKRTMELVNAANSAAGASSLQYEKTMESLETKLAKLKNAWNEFTMSLANSSLIKGAADFATGVLSFINKVSSKLPTFLNGMLKLGILTATFLTVAAAADVFERSVRTAIMTEVAEKGAAGRGILATLSHIKAGFVGIGEAIKENLIPAMSRFLKSTWANIASLGTLGKVLFTNNAAIKANNVGFKESIILKLQNALADGTLASGSLGAAIAQKILGVMTNGVNVALAVQIGLIAAIVIAIGALIALMVVGFRQVNDSLKLEKINKDIQIFQKQLDESKERLESLTETKSKLDDLKNKFAGLAKGTAEWKQTLIESNQEVLKLLREYPQLMAKGKQFYSRDTNGFLSISEEGFDAIMDAEEKKITSLNQSLVSENMLRLSVQNEAAAKRFRSGPEWVKETEDFFNESTFGKALKKTGTAALATIAPIASAIGTVATGGVWGGRDLTDTRGGSDEQYVALVKALTEQGLMPEKLTLDDMEELGSQLGLGVGQIKIILDRLGDNFDDFSAEIEQNYAAIEEYRRQFVDSVVDDSVENSEQVEEILTKGGADYEKQITEEYDKIGSLKDDELQEYAAGNNMTLSMVKDQIDDGSLTETAIKQYLATTRMTSEAEKAAKENEKMVKDLQENRQYGDALTALLTTDARDITAGQFDVLISDLITRGGSGWSWSINKEVLAEAGISLTKEMEKTLLDNMAIASSNYGLATQKGLSRINVRLGDLPTNLNLTTIKGLDEKIYQVLLTSGKESASAVFEKFKNLADKLPSEKINEFASVIEGLDWADTQSWARLEERLEAAGITLDKRLNAELEDFVKYAIEASKAIQKIDWEKMGTALMTLQKTITEIQTGEKNRIFSKEEYEAIKVLDYNESKNFRQDLDGNYIYTGTNSDNIVKKFSNISGDERQKAIEILAARANNAASIANYTQDEFNANTSRRTLQDRVEDVLRNLRRGTSIESLGIEGLTSVGSLENADANTLLKFYNELRTIGQNGSDIYLNSIKDIEEATRSPWALNPIEQAIKAHVYDKDAMRDLSAMGATLGVADDIIADFVEAMNTNSDDLEDAKKRLAEASSFQVTIAQFKVLSDSLKELGEQLDNTTDADHMNALQTIADKFSITITSANADAFEKNYREFMSGNFQAYQRLYEQAAKQLADDPQIARKLVNMGLGKGVLKDGTFQVEMFTEEMFAALFEESSRQEVMDDLMKRIYDAIVAMREKTISKMEEIDKTVASANKDLVNTMKKTITQQRQDRSNDKTQQDIADKQRRLAYLQMDTTGANAVEAEKLQKEIAEDQQSYQDTLLDQKLAQFEEDNNIAQEQRQEQIEILKQQLENDKNSGAIWASVMAVLNGADLEHLDTSELFRLLKEGEGLLSMSPETQQQWITDLRNALAYVAKGSSTSEIDSSEVTVDNTPILPSRITGHPRLDSDVVKETYSGPSYVVNIGTIYGDGNSDVEALKKAMGKVIGNHIRF